MMKTNFFLNYALFREISYFDDKNVWNAVENEMATRYCSMTRFYFGTITIEDDWIKYDTNFVFIKSGSQQEWNLRDSS